ncbi:MAG TPA: DUF3455 domain-containing protein [Candidatus Dormibacteraeota bacterium]|nr:DUF3455 domain-containing protein [Candidatus Dormibacteraeota bacterium]
MTPTRSALGAAALCVGIAAAAHAQSAPEVPPAIKAPPGEKLVLSAHAAGVQIYTCTAGADGKPQWVLKAPEAQLRDEHGAVIGQHGAGPSWHHGDGSSVNGKMVARAEAPDGKSIPWLLLSATAHGGAGVLEHVSSIQRIHTEGGAAPDAASCDPQKEQNQEVRVPYRADYYFYAPDAARH